MANAIRCAPADTNDTSAFTPLSARVQRFLDDSRERCAAGTVCYRRPNFDAAFFGQYADRPHWERYTRSVAQALEQAPVYVFDDEELVGMLYQIAPPPPGYDPDEERWKPFCAGHQARTRIERELDPRVAGGGAPGHIGWRWDRVLQEGVSGIMTDLQRRLDAAADVKAKRFFRGALILWRSVLRWNRRHVEALRAKASEATGPECARLRRLAAICERVPRHPARTFHEAIQCFHFQHLAVMFANPYGGNGPGRIDYFLWPYLARDLETGAISEQEAKDLVDELFIRFHERLWQGDGWVEAVSPGGTHPDGRCAVNPLSYMMIHSIGALEQTHPVVYPRVSAASPPDFIDLCATYLVHGRNRAQIYNDDACVPAIVRSGTRPEDAAMYMAGGCMEISVQGMNCDLNFSRTHHVAKTLELVLNGGVDLLNGNRVFDKGRVLGEYTNFEHLYGAFEQRLSYEYDQMVRGLDIQSECYAKYRPTYMMSSLIGDCLERGREQQDGGARYHEYGFAPLGISAAADSLTAIRRAVFEDGFVSGGELLAALRANFEGYEALRQRLQALPKFGVEDPDADAMCNRVMTSVCTLATAPRARFGGQLKPMIFNFVWTPWACQVLGARGDGSPAGATIGHGMTPASSAMTKGLPAALNSTLSLDFSVVSGGATTMWDMDADWINVARMGAILRRFLDGGGMIFQGNTTSVRELENAFENPDRYPNLIVRVGGFSARFTTLSPELQRDIIARRRHGPA